MDWNVFVSKNFIYDTQLSILKVFKSDQESGRKGFPGL